MLVFNVFPCLALESFFCGSQIVGASAALNLEGYFFWDFFPVFFFEYFPVFWWKEGARKEGRKEERKKEVTFS